MIYCGFAGIGKTTAAKTLPGVVDLESTPFQRDWRTYARVASHVSRDFTVLVSCHPGLREELHRIGQPYKVALPPIGSKWEYRCRYIERGDTRKFVDTMMGNWYAFSFVWPHEDVVVVSTNMTDHLSG